MATRFYTDPTNAPSVSPAFNGGWTDTSQAIRRQLVLDSPGVNDSITIQLDETATYNDTILAAQFVSPPLNALDPVQMSGIKASFRLLESNAKANVYLYLRYRKCDGDGSNVGEFYDGFAIDTTEADESVLTNRNLSTYGGDTSLAQGQRVVIEVGLFFEYSKVSSYTGSISITDNSGTDLGANNTDTAAYNSGIEIGDTFTVASGDPPWEVVKLGPMFAFA